MYCSSFFRTVAIAIAAGTSTCTSCVRAFFSRLVSGTYYGVAWKIPGNLHGFTFYPTVCLKVILSLFLCVCACVCGCLYVAFRGSACVSVLLLRLRQGSRRISLHAPQNAEIQLNFQSASFPIDPAYKPLAQASESDTGAGAPPPVPTRHGS